MSELINYDTISEWKKKGFSRKISPVYDALSILKNDNRNDLLLTLIVYIDYSIVQLGGNIDFPNRSCRRFFNEESPLRYYAEEAYKKNNEVDVYDEEFDDVDVLADYIRTQDDYTIEQFIWYYLMALCGKDFVDPPEEFFENFDELVAEQLIVLINQLRYY
jgi:hypothetical protein